MLWQIYWKRSSGKRGAHNLPQELVDHVRGLVPGLLGPVEVDVGLPAVVLVLLADLDGGAAGVAKLVDLGAAAADQAADVVLGDLRSKICSRLPTFNNCFQSFPLEWWSSLPAAAASSSRCCSSCPWEAPGAADRWRGWRSTRPSLRRRPWWRKRDTRS